MATNPGTIKTYPIVTFLGPGELRNVSNYTTSQFIWINNYVLATGEKLVLDLRPGKKTFTSSFAGNIVSSILPGSDTDEFHLTPGNNFLSLGLLFAPANNALITFPERHASFSGVAANE